MTLRSASAPSSAPPSRSWRFCWTSAAGRGARRLPPRRVRAPRPPRPTPPRSTRRARSWSHGSRTRSSSGPPTSTLQIPGSFQALKAQSELLQREIADLRRKQSSSPPPRRTPPRCRRGGRAGPRGGAATVAAGSVTFADPASAELLLGAHGAEAGPLEAARRSENARTLTLRRPAHGARGARPLARGARDGARRGAAGGGRRAGDEAALRALRRRRQLRTAAQARWWWRAPAVFDLLSTRPASMEHQTAGAGRQAPGLARRASGLYESREDAWTSSSCVKPRRVHPGRARAAWPLRPRQTFGAGGGRAASSACIRGPSSAAMPCLCCAIPAGSAEASCWPSSSPASSASAPFAGSLALLAISFSVYSGVGERRRSPTPTCSRRSRRSRRAALRVRPRRACGVLRRQRGAGGRGSRRGFRSSESSCR